MSNEYGGGKYNMSAAVQVRKLRIQQSLETNPQFSFDFPRFGTAFSESAFLFRFFVDGRDTSAALNLTVARGFFDTMQMPEDFHRRNGSFDLPDLIKDINVLFDAVVIAPGHNDGLGNYTESGVEVFDVCSIYDLNIAAIQRLYPAPSGALLDAINVNLGNLFSAVEEFGCTEFLYS